jgi:hypothetical protein
VKARSGPPAQGGRQERLGHRHESETYPHAVEPLGTGEEGVEGEGSRGIDQGRDELGGDLEGLDAGRRVHDHRPVDEAVCATPLAEDTPDGSAAGVGLPGELARVEGGRERARELE